MKSNIDLDKHTSDWVLRSSLSKLINNKAVLSHPTMWEALHWAILEEGLLHIPVDKVMSNVQVIYEVLDPVRSFVNASITGKYKNSTFFVMDSWDPETIMIMYDRTFKSPDNLFVATHGTPLRKSITAPGSVITATFDPEIIGRDVVPVKQLISLKSFL